MSECKLDHTPDDVRKKYESQMEYLPQELFPLFERFFAGEPSQQELNELFHLLKKYDLATSEEREERDKKITALLQR